MKSLEENRLPEGWVWTTLGEIARWGSGGTPLKGKSGYYGGGIPWLKIGDLNEGSVFTSLDAITQNGLENSSAKWVEKGSLLVAMYGSIGKLGIAGIKLTTNQAIAFTKLDDSSLSTKFVFWYIRSIRSDLFNQSKGATQKNISQTVLKQIHFPLPPLPEQHRIVTKIEELFTQLDAGGGALTKAKAQLKRYRQSVLKSACEGRLVLTEAELARAEGRDYEPADVLLARIGKERREKWEAEKTRKGKKSAKYKEPAAPDVCGSPELPEGWCWVAVERIAHVGTGATPLKSNKKYYEGGSIPWVTSSALNEFCITEPRSFVTELALRETNLTLYPKHTLLMAMYGEGKTRGKCSELLIEATTNQAIAALVPDGASGTCRPYLKIFLLKNYNETRSKSSGGVQPNLNLGLVKTLTLPLPPLLEQHRIVAEIERRLSVADEIRKTIDQSLKQADRLRQSILKRAFEGKLVSQDPNDEPASVLLERIKAEKAKCEAEKKTENKRKRKGNPKQKKSI